MNITYITYPNQLTDNPLGRWVFIHSDKYGTYRRKITWVGGENFEWSGGWCGLDQITVEADGTLHVYDYDLGPIR